MANEKGPGPKIIGDISIYPIGEGTSLGDYVRAAFGAMKKVQGVRLVPTAMSTIVEADRLDDILLALKEAHSVLLRMGSQRIAIYLRIDHRLDKPESIEYKVHRVEG